MYDHIHVFIHYHLYYYLSIIIIYYALGMVCTRISLKFSSAFFLNFLKKSNAHCGNMTEDDDITLNRHQYFFFFLFFFLVLDVYLYIFKLHSVICTYCAPKKTVYSKSTISLFIKNSPL